MDDEPIDAETYELLVAGRRDAAWRIVGGGLVLMIGGLAWLLLHLRVELSHRDPRILGGAAAAVGALLVIVGIVKLVTARVTFAWGPRDDG